jgi:hypothetical protein
MPGAKPSATTLFDPFRKLARTLSHLGSAVRSGRKEMRMTHSKPDPETPLEPPGPEIPPAPVPGPEIEPPGAPPAPPPEPRPEIPPHAPPPRTSPPTAGPAAANVKPLSPKGTI